MYLVLGTKNRLKEEVLVNIPFRLLCSYYITDSVHTVEDNVAEKLTYKFPVVF